MLDTLLATCISFPTRAKRTAITIRVKEMHHTGNRWLYRQTAVVTGQSNGAVRGTMIGAIPRKDFMPSRIESRNFDRILVRFGTTEGEERFLQVPGRDFCQFFAE
jgi:hypothetical protein